MRQIITLIAFIALAGWLVQPVFPQTDPKPEVTTADGENSRIRFHGNVINFSSGDVSCRCGGLKSPAHFGLSLSHGDAIETAHGRAEILLNPGYYLRLDENSAVELLDVSFGNLKIGLVRGSVILEIAGDTWPTVLFLEDWKEHLFNVVTVITPRDTLAIARAGVYRFDMMPEGRVDVRVIKGRIAIPGHMLKERTRALVLDGRVDASPVDEKSVDAFDTWSRARAQELVTLNKALKKREWFKDLQESAADLDTAESEALIDASTRRTISALAGMIEFTESGTQIMHPKGDWQDLKSEDSLSDGDRLRTAGNGRAEIRPYPFFYFFLGSGTEIGYAENEHGDVTISVFTGAVIVDVPKSKETTAEAADLTLLAENSEYHITRPGYYRLNVIPSVGSEMIVRFGALKNSTQVIEAARRIVRDKAGEQVTSFDRATLDSFDVWSDHRVARYVNLNVGTKRLRKFWTAAAWVFDDTTNQFTMLPGGVPYESPYGGKYSVVYELETRRPKKPKPANPP